MKRNKSSLFMMNTTIICSDTGLVYQEEQHIHIQLGIPRNYCSNVGEKVIRIFREVFIEGLTLIDVKDIEDAAEEDGWGIPHDREFELGSAGQKYDAMVKNGRISSAVKMVTNRDPRWLYRPNDV